MISIRFIRTSNILESNRLTAPSKPGGARHSGPYQAGGGSGGQGKHLGIGSYWVVITLNAGAASRRASRILFMVVSGSFGFSS
jgi:hypothetical protein